MIIMRILNYLNKPEYVFNPGQIYRKLLVEFRGYSNEFETVFLPWGVPIKIRPNEVIGHAILTTGIYDLSVTEVIYRLLDLGETAVDIGANIGYMTSLMASKVGKTGKIWAFEPHSEIFEELLSNINHWYNSKNWPQINAQQIALSNQNGNGRLNLANEFLKNRGIGTLESISLDNSLITPCSVTLAKLDERTEILATSGQIEVLKIDVEGHELKVLEGASELISKQKIRDIIFEEHNNYPTPVTQRLESNGYTIFRIWKGFWKPLLKNPENKLVHPWEAPNYLATKQPERAVKRLNNPGYLSLQKFRFL